MPHGTPDGSSATCRVTASAIAGACPAPAMCIILTWLSCAPAMCAVCACERTPQLTQPHLSCPMSRLHMHHLRLRCHLRCHLLLLPLLAFALPRDSRHRHWDRRHNRGRRRPTRRRHYQLIHLHYTAYLCTWRSYLLRHVTHANQLPITPLISDVLVDPPPSILSSISPGLTMWGSCTRPK
jgi:hypothetical protein